LWLVLIRVHYEGGGRRGHAPLAGKVFGSRCARAGWGRRQKRHAGVCYSGPRQRWGRKAPKRRGEAGQWEAAHFCRLGSGKQADHGFNRQHASAAAVPGPNTRSADQAPPSFAPGSPVYPAAGRGSFRPWMVKDRAGSVGYHRWGLKTSTTPPSRVFPALWRFGRHLQASRGSLW